MSSELGALAAEGRPAVRKCMTRMLAEYVGQLQAETLLEDRESPAYAQSARIQF